VFLWSFLFRFSIIVIMERTENKTDKIEISDIVVKSLQQMLSTGDWVDVSEDEPNSENRFLDMCVEYNADISTHDEAIAAMHTGRELRNDASDWYSKCRLFDAAEHKRKMIEYDKQQEKLESEKKTCTCCGSRDGMFTTIASGSVCDDCI